MRRRRGSPAAHGLGSGAGRPALRSAGCGSGHRRAAGRAGLTTRPFGHPMPIPCPAPGAATGRSATRRDGRPSGRRLPGLRIEPAGAQAKRGAVPAEAAGAIARAAALFGPDPERLREGRRRGGVTLPDLPAQPRGDVGPPRGRAPPSRRHQPGRASQDVIDTALVMRLAPGPDLLGVRLDRLIDASGATDARGDRGRRRPARGRARRGRSRSRTGPRPGPQPASRRAIQSKSGWLANRQARRGPAMTLR